MIELVTLAWKRTYEVNTISPMIAPGYHVVSAVALAVKPPPASGDSEVRAVCLVWLVRLARHTMAALLLFVGPERSSLVGNANWAPTFFRSLL
ncbi:MAG: hypothetical protein [Circular genetic element sp.]|nr:MAG: hypothetical protein [Circular genetic element sp.]